ncbi:MAG: DUF4340 domain-containing protein [Bacteroidota bacterium]
MFKKLTTGKLLVALLALGLVYFGLQFFGNKKRSSSFREVLVDIDTAKSTKVVITKSGEELKLLKEEGDWLVELDNGKKVEALNSSVIRSLESLNTIKPGRVAAKKEEKWKDYSVDSSGTRIQVFEDEKKALDIVLGRFGVKGQRQFYTFVRLWEDDEVYTSDNFMGASFSTESGNYRDKTLVKAVKDSIQQIDFVYPNDSSFNLVKSESGTWILDGEEPADSAQIATFLNGLRVLNGQSFKDEEISTSVDFEIKIYQTGKDIISVDGYENNGEITVNSSLNEKSFFVADQNLKEKLFKGKRYFLEGGS